MNKIYKIILIFLLCSCSFDNPNRYAMYEFDFNEAVLNNRIEAMEWVYYNIEWKRHPSGTQTPQETMKKRTGLCRDQAVLLLAIIYDVFGDKGSLVIIDRGDIAHSVTKVGSKIYDQTKNKRYEASKYLNNNNVINTIDFNDIYTMF